MTVYITDIHPRLCRLSSISSSLLEPNNTVNNTIFAMCYSDKDTDGPVPGGLSNRLQWVCSSSLLYFFE